MTKGGEFRHILAFSLPLFLGNIFQQLYNLVDSVVIGRFRGPDALAAVGAAFPILFLMVAIVMGLSMGSTIMVSQFFGAKDFARLRRTYSTSLIFFLALSAVLTIVGLLAARPLLVLLGTPEALLPDALAYLRVLFAGFLAMVLYNGFSAFLRGIGDSKTPLYFLILASVLNVFLDILFVVAFGMGTGGVALATVIAQAVSGLLCFLYIDRKVPMLRLRRKDFVFDAALLKDAIRLGLPMATQQSVLALGGLAVQGLVNSYGATTIAAYWAATRIDQIATTFILSIGMATTTFTGQNVGAGRLDRIGKGLRASMSILVVLCVAITGAVLLFGETLIGLFVERSTADPALLAAIVSQGAEYMRVVSLFYIVFGLMFCTNGVLRGAGDVMVPLYTTLAALSVRVAVGYALSAVPWIGYRGIWWSIPIAWVLSSSISAMRYLSGAWKKKALLASGRTSGGAEASVPSIVKEECG